MPASFVEENACERERLHTLVNQLSDEELNFDAGDGWTVSALLAHMAFWDYRALVLLQRWKRTGIEASPIDVDGVNDAVLPLCLAIPPRDAVNLAMAAAEKVDHELETASPEMIASIEAQGKFKLGRWEHRREHREQIERILENKR